MNWRTARVIIGLLAVVCLGLVASVVYPVSTSTPHAALPPDEQFSVGDREAFSVSAQLTVDGEPRLALDGTVTAEGARYRRVADSGSTAEAYQAGPNDPVYERYTIRRESLVDSHRDAISGAADRTVLRETDTAEGTVLVVRANESFEFAAELSGSASLFVSSLGLTSYDRVDGTDTTRIYAPQNGWFDEGRAYRITDASGQVRVDNETGVVESASVAWDLSRPADTYAHDRLARLFGDQPERYEVDYDFETNASNVSRPAWVPEEASAATP